MTGARRSGRWLGLSSWLLAAGSCLAQPAASMPAVGPPAARASGPAWSALTPAQRQALAPLQREWPALDETRKAKWLELAQRLPKMAPPVRERIQQRMSEWAAMTPDQRARARLQFHQNRQLLAPAERQAQWEAYQALPEDVRQGIAERARPAPRPGSSAPATPRWPAQDREAPQAKRNIVAPPRTTVPRQVTPAVVQSKPGATTTLLTQPVEPPLHQQTGLPKITATQGFVHPSTLLPQRGPQGAAVVRRPPAAPAASAPRVAPPPPPAVVADEPPARPPVADDAP